MLLELDGMDFTLITVQIVLVHKTVFCTGAVIQHEAAKFRFNPGTVR